LETDEKKPRKKSTRVRWTNYEIFELRGEFTTPCVASQTVLLSEERDEKGRKVISKYVFPRDQRGRAYFPPGWIAGLLENVATKDFWQLAPMLRATNVQTTLPPDQILKLFENQRLAGSHIRNFTFMECEIIGEASPFFDRYSISFKDKSGKKAANIFDGETFPAGTQFKLKILAPRIFYKQSRTLLEIGGGIEGVGPLSLRRQGFGRFKVLSFKRVKAEEEAETD